MRVYRTRRLVWGTERTLVVLVSPRLQQGQRRGVEQHLAKAVRWLDQLQATLARGRQRAFAQPDIAPCFQKRHF